MSSRRFTFEQLLQEPEILTAINSKYINYKGNLNPCSMLEQLTHLNKEVGKFFIQVEKDFSCTFVFIPNKGYELLPPLEQLKYPNNFYYNSKYGITNRKQLEVRCSTSYPLIKEYDLVSITPPIIGRRYTETEVSNNLNNVLLALTICSTDIKGTLPSYSILHVLNQLNHKYGEFQIEFDSPSYPRFVFIPNKGYENVALENLNFPKGYTFNNLTGITSNVKGGKNYPIIKLITTI